MGTCSINFVVRPLVLIKFTPILLSLLLFDLIDLLHDKDGLFSYIIIGLSITVSAVFIKCSSVYQPLTSVDLLYYHKSFLLEKQRQKQRLDYQ